MTPISPAYTREDLIAMIHQRDELVSALKETVQRSSEQPAHGWQPIETAPRDGTAIMLGFWYQGRFAQYQAFYSPAGWMENSRSFHPKHMQEWFELWHPLPKAPTTSVSGPRGPKVRTSRHRNKEEAARLQALVDERYAAPATAVVSSPVTEKTDG